MNRHIESMLRGSAPSLLGLAVLLIGVLAVTLQPPTLLGEPTAVIDTGVLNVRAGPSPGFPILAQVEKGTIVTMLTRDSKSSWVKVRLAEGIVGWISTYYIIPDVRLDSLPVEVQAEPWGVVQGTAYVRSGPGMSFPVVTTVSDARLIGILARNAETTWLMVRIADNMVGWISSAYVLSETPFVNLPLDSAALIITPLPAIPTPLPTTMPTFGAGRVTAGTLNLRYGPGTGFGILLRLPEGAVLDLLGRNRSGEWLFIRTADGTAGWVGSIGITAAIDVNVLPVTNTVIAGVYGSAKVLAGGLNLRSGPNTTYPVVTIVHEGDDLNLLGRNASGSWVKVRTLEGVEGWVASAEIEPYVPIYTLPEATYQPIATYGTATVTAGGLNIHSSSSLAASVVEVVLQGERLSLLGRSADSNWVKVITPTGVIGWAASGEVTLDVPMNDLPVVTDEQVYG